MRTPSSVLSSQTNSGSGGGGEAPATSPPPQPHPPPAAQIVELVRGRAPKPEPLQEMEIFSGLLPNGSIYYPAGVGVGGWLRLFELAKEINCGGGEGGYGGG